MARYFLVFLALAGPGVIAIVSPANSMATQTVTHNAPFLIAFALLVLCVLWGARKFEGATPDHLGFRRSGYSSVPRAWFLTIFFIFVFGPIAYAFVAWLGHGNFETIVNRFRQLPTWYMILTIVVVAGGEEWLYRGYAIERLESLTGSTVLTGTLSLAAFVVVHLPVWGAGLAITTLVSGAILTLAYIVTRDIAALIAAHVVTDLYGLLISRVAT